MKKNIERKNKKKCDPPGPSSTFITPLPAKDNEAIRRKYLKKAEKELSPEDFDRLVNLSNDYWNDRIQKHPDEGSDDEIFGLLDRNETIK